MGIGNRKVGWWKDLQILVFSKIKIEEVDKELYIACTIIEFFLLGQR